MNLLDRGKSFLKNLNKKKPESIANPLEKEIRQFIEYEYLLAETEGDPKFGEPCPESEITAWESKNGVSVPEDYKAWLMFTRSCRMHFYFLELRFPELKSETIFKDFSEFPDDLVIIGEWVGDGELICFSKENGKIYTFYDGNITDRGTFKEFLNEHINDLSKEIEEEYSIDEAYNEEINELLSRLG